MYYNRQSDISKQNDILIDILSSYLCKKDILIQYKDIDWKYISSLAMEQGMGGILFKAVENNKNIDDKTYQKLLFYYEKSLFMCAARNEALARISLAFEKEEIDFLVLKGAIIQEYYPSPELRVMSDVDIYIKTEDRKKAKNVLSSLDIPFLKSNSYQDIYKTKNGIIIEVHHALWGYNLEKTKLYTDIWNSSNVVQEKKHTYILSTSDLYIFIIAHLFKHFKESGIGIRTLFDIWFIFKKSISDIDFDYVKSQLSYFDAVEFEKKIRTLVKAVFLKEEKDDSLLLILDYMLKSKTHGSESISAANATKGKNRLNHIISRLFPPLSQMKRRYNILEKLYFLLPFFWVWRIITLPFMEGKLKSNIDKISKIDTETQNYVKNVFIAAGISKSSNKKNKGMSFDLKYKLIFLSVIIVFLSLIFCLIYFRNEQTGINNIASETEESIVSENESSDISEYISESVGSNYGTISWKNGRYTGYLTNNIPNGSGEHIVENSYRYVGFFVNGSYDGFGKIEYSDGSYYEGEFKNNQANGEGTLYCANGDIINGIFSEGQPGGFCNYEYSDGNLFTGTMINGLKHGEGTFYWLNGDKYVGSFVDDRRDGYGILYYSNGDTYSGNWSQGFCNGFGTYSWSNGTKYEGNFEIGLMNDTDCVIYYPDGSKYNGEITDGVKNGKGQLTYANGDIAKGTFVSGALSGEAEYYFNDKKIWAKVIYEKGKIIKYILD